MQVTLAQIYYDKEEKVGKSGKPYHKLNIKTQEHGERWLSGFSSPANRNWKSGDTVEIEVKENGKYLNYSPMSARQPSKTWDKINELDQRLSKVEKMLVKQPLKEAPEPKLMPISDNEEPQLDDLPF